MSKLIYGLLAIVGVIAVVGCAIAIAAVATASDNKQQLSSVQRSLSVGGATGGTVVASGTYRVYATYIVPANPTQMSVNAAGGTFTYTALQDSTGAVNFMRLVFSPMTFTFTSAPTAILQDLYFGGFAPTSPLGTYAGSPLCKAFSLTSSASGTQGPFNVVSMAFAQTGGPIVVRIGTTDVGTTITSGYTLSLSTNLEMVVGVLPN